jgi:hypothetical protein
VTVEQKRRAGLRESASYERNGSEEIEEDGRARLRRERWPRDTFDQEAQKGKLALASSITLRGLDKCSCLARKAIDDTVEIAETPDSIANRSSER